MADETQETQPGLNRSEEVYLIREAERTLRRLGSEPGQAVDSSKLAQAWTIVEVRGGFAILDATSGRVLDVRRTIRSDVDVIIRQVASRFAA
jgi:hypothetical protein